MVHPRSQNRQASWSAGGRRERLWGSGIITAEIEVPVTILEDPTTILEDHGKVVEDPAKIIKDPCAGSCAGS